jgi:hypothetical protein
VDGLEWEQFAGVLLMADGKNKGLFLANSLECFESNNKVKMDDALAVFLFAIGNNLISMEIFNSWKNEMEIFKREYL